MEEQKLRGLSRRDFLYITGLVTLTLGTQTGLSLAAVKAQAHRETPLASTSLWNRLGIFMTDDVLPNTVLYSQYSYGLEDARGFPHPLGCPCCS